MRLTQFAARHARGKKHALIAAFFCTVILFCNAVSAKPAPILDEASIYALSTQGLTADDATDPDKVLAWMKKIVDLEEGKAVFYSDAADFSDAFGGANPKDEDIAKACSQAFAEFAEGQTRVFNDAGAGENSYWKKIELPGLNENSKVTEIWSMIDDTTDPFDFGENLKNANDGELSYVPGFCGVHVVQYQKNEPTVNPNPDYKFDITIKDYDETQIGQLLFADAPDAVGVGVDSQLPYVLIVTAGAVDSDPVSFAYAGDIWDSDGSSCGTTAYGRGTRQIDCSFDCSPDGEMDSDIKRLGRKNVNL